MKIATVVDGVSEYAAIRSIRDALGETTGSQFIRPVKADIQPKAPVGVIIRQSLKQIRIVSERDVDLVVLLLDREDRAECAGNLAEEIQQGLAAQDYQVAVVLKDRAFENWVIADIDAVRACTGRFDVSEATARAVQPNKADNVDAIELLKRSAKGGYDKVQDGRKILEKADMHTVAQHSRSFRRFLRVVGCPVYSQQSAQPA